MPTDPSSSKAVIGVWAGASRRAIRMPTAGRAPAEAPARGSRSRASAIRCSTRSSCRWAARTSGTRPTRPTTAASLSYVQHPELASLLPVLYPHVFPNLASLNSSGKSRADLVAILLTGLPSGIVPGFQNFTGKRHADMLRLNTAIPPTTSSPNTLGLLGGDLAGFPNGRRVFDDVVDDRAAGDRRRHVSARCEHLHPRRRGRARLGAADPGRRPLPAGVPVRGNAARRLQHAVAVIQRGAPAASHPAAGAPTSKEDETTVMHAQLGHTHPGPHVHDHPHAHPADDPHGEAHRPHPEPVVLDIGGELGALVIYTNRQLLHAEIEISPARRRLVPQPQGRAGARRRRRARCTSPCSTGCPEGTYTIWRDDRPLTRRATIGGRRGHRARLDRAVAVDDDRCAGPAARPSRGS